MRSFINHCVECDIYEKSAVFVGSLSGNYLASRKIDSPNDMENLLSELEKSGYKELVVNER